MVHVSYEKSNNLPFVFKNVTRTLYSKTTFRVKYRISYIRSVYIKEMAKKNKKENKKGGTDPKAAALAFLNINLGSKNIRTLKT